jgi:rhamnogalacturonan endolyase
MNVKVCIVILLSATTFSCKKKEHSSAYRITDKLYEEKFDRPDTSHWVVEAEGDFRLADHITGGSLDIDFAKGITIWNTTRFKNNVLFEFEATVVNKGGRNDRISDLNCFWMATDPAFPDNFFERSSWRKGIFYNYYSLNLYYVGYGGNENTTTRFRKYNGIADPQPAIIQEYTDTTHLIVPNVKHLIQVVCLDSTVSYFFNGERLFQRHEKQPLQEGYFGFRTVNNHMKIDRFTVYAIEAHVMD